jgi:hypothetical protein
MTRPAMVASLGMLVAAVACARTAPLAVTSPPPRAGTSEWIAPPTAAVSLLPPPPEGPRARDEDSLVPGAPLPADARLIKPPPWARLQAVWGVYDPPPFQQAVFDRDPRLVILLEQDGTLAMWDHAAHEVRLRIDTCKKALPENAKIRRNVDDARLLATSPEGLAAIGFASGTFCVLDLATGALLTRLEGQSLSLGPAQADVRAARIVGQTLLSYADQYRIGGDPAFSRPRPLKPPPPRTGWLQSWDVRTGAKLSDVHVGGTQSVATLSPDGASLAFCDWEPRLVGRDGRTRWELTKLPLQRLVFATNETLVGCSRDRLFMVEARDGAARDVLAIQRGPSEKAASCTGLVVTESGSHAVASFDDGRQMLWDIRATTIVSRSPPPGLPAVRHLSPDGALLATDELAMFGTASFKLLDAPGRRVDCLALSADAQRAVTCRIRLGRPVFDLWDGGAQTFGHWERAEYTKAVLDPSGAFVLVRTDDRDELRDWSTGTPLWSRSRPGRSDAAFSPDGGKVALVHWHERERKPNMLAALVEIASGKVLWENDALRRSAAFVTFAPDGQGVLVGETRNPEDQLPGQDLVTLSIRDGSVTSRVGRLEQGRLTAIGDRALWVDDDRGATGYDVDSGKRLWTSDESKGNGYGMRVAAVPGTGTFVQTFGGTVRLREARTGKDLGPPLDLAPSADHAVRIAVSADGATLVVGTHRGVLLRFALDTRRARRGKKPY